MNYRVLRFLFLIIASITWLTVDPNSTTPGSRTKNGLPLPGINEYLRVNLPRCTIIDSIELYSLNSILYDVDDVNSADEDDYVIIMDRLTGQFYPIVRHHWPSFNRRLPQELQLMVLKSDSAGQIIEPVNYDFLGLEAFLNNCKILENREINLNALDTIFRFYENEFIRITETNQVDKILDRILLSSGEEKSQIASYIEAKRAILMKKILRENVFLYSLPYDWPEFIVYFELNPGVSTYCFEVTQDDREYLQDNKMFFKPLLHGNQFNLVYLWIE